MSSEKLESLEKELAPFSNVNDECEDSPPIAFQRPSEIISYVPPPGSRLVGDNHLNRGALSVIAGAPGVGKSRAAMALAIAGATGADWFGLKTHSRFKTLVIQNENGAMRLKNELLDIGVSGLDGFVLISTPPAFGLEFYNEVFVTAVRRAVTAFKPDVVIIDPWTALIVDDRGKDYREMLQQLRAVFGAGDGSPAILVVAHTRKPKSGEGAPRGRGLMHEVAGSYVLTSSARSVFSLVAANDDPSDDRVIFENPKNNDGTQPKPTAWHRRNGLFVACVNFDWKSYNDRRSDSGRAAIGVGDLREIFEQAGGAMTRLEAAKALMSNLGCARSVAYQALRLPGGFSDFIKEDNGVLRWNAAAQSESEIP